MTWVAVTAFSVRLIGVGGECIDCVVARLARCPGEFVRLMAVVAFGMGDAALFGTCDFGSVAAGTRSGGDPRLLVGVVTVGAAVFSSGCGGRFFVVTWSTGNEGRASILGVARCTLLMLAWTPGEDGGDLSLMAQGAFADSSLSGLVAFVTAGTFVVLAEVLFAHGGVAL